ncbi:MAG: methionyl-tRNA synthetase [Myxococcota bacterium]|jgi:methionyl-tRNA synthetase
MSRHIITSALPYVNGIKHLGNLVGSLLPADVAARHLRREGHEVIFLCGTDEQHLAEACDQVLGALQEAYDQHRYREVVDLIRQLLRLGNLYIGGPALSSSASMPPPQLRFCPTPPSGSLRRCTCRSMGSSSRSRRCG